VAEVGSAEREGALVGDDIADALDIRPHRRQLRRGTDDGLKRELRDELEEPVLRGLVSVSGLQIHRS
jgi:hypothetical protein